MWLVPHRSRLLSHGLVIAPLLRLLYFYLMVVLLLIASAWLLALVGIALPDLHIRLRDTLLGLMRDHPRETLAFVAGFITGSAAHSIADWLVTGGKRYIRRMGFRVTVTIPAMMVAPRSRRARSWAMINKPERFRQADSDDKICSRSVHLGKIRPRGQRHRFQNQQVIARDIHKLAVDRAVAGNVSFVKASLAHVVRVADIEHTHTTRTNIWMCKVRGFRSDEDLAGGV